MGIGDVGIPLPEFWPEERVIHKSGRDSPEGVSLFDRVDLLCILFLLSKQGDGDTEAEGQDQYDTKPEQFLNHIFLPIAEL